MEWYKGKIADFLLQRMVAIGNTYIENKKALREINRQFGKISKKKGYTTQEVEKAFKKFDFYLPDGTKLKIKRKKKPETKKKVKELEERLSKIFEQKTVIHRVCSGKLQYHFEFDDKMVICLDFGQHKNFRIYVHGKGRGYSSRVLGFSYFWLKNYLEEAHNTGG